MINIINKANWRIADEYFMQYKTTIETDFPILDGKTIEICESKEYHNQFIIDLDSPTQMMVKDKDPKLDNDTILYVCNYRNIPDSIDVDFTEKELFALISHELGHIVAHYENEDDGTIKEEIIADSFANNVKLRESLICALEKIKNHKEEKKKEPFANAQGIEKEIIDIICRIKTLRSIG